MYLLCEVGYELDAPRFCFLFASESRLAACTDSELPLSADASESSLGDEICSAPCRLTTLMTSFWLVKRRDGTHSDGWESSSAH